jgi:hypothetical protein
MTHINICSVKGHDKYEIKKKKFMVFRKYHEDHTNIYISVMLNHMMFDTHDHFHYTIDSFLLIESNPLYGFARQLSNVKER